MIKKIYIFLFIGLLIASCGKKGDPIYKENGKPNSRFCFKPGRLSLKCNDDTYVEGDY